MNYTWIAVIIIYIVFTHIIAKNMGERREIGYGKSILWSMVLTPIIGFFITKMSKPIEK